MKRAKKAAVALAVGTAMYAVIGTVQAQEVVPCRSEVGFATTPPDAIGPIMTSAWPQAFTGAWGAVYNNRSSFSSRNYVTNKDGSPAPCTVKVVTTPARGSGKPATTDYIAPAGSQVDMTMDECSMYKYLSSVDSKMAQGKASDALIIIDSMIEKIGKMQMNSEDGRAAIDAAARAVLLCVAPL